MFRFCGDLDCPDWVLAEISTLAKMSSVKLRLLCSQVLKELLGQGIDPGWDPQDVRLHTAEKFLKSGPHSPVKVTQN
uniref:COMM domain containing 4 n=1 Tax=Cebus imitator TaxID=2715852 RepID=A0A2K5QJ70_CEBIM